MAYARRPARRPPPGPQRAVVPCVLGRRHASILISARSSPRWPGRPGPSSPRWSWAPSCAPTGGSPGGQSTTSGPSSWQPLVTVIAMVVAVPARPGSAIYLSEYASPRCGGSLKPTLEILAGIPSVVLGFFALIVISPPIVQHFIDGAGLFNLMAAGIGVGILVVPLVASVSEDALRSCPTRCARPLRHGRPEDHHRHRSWCRRRSPASSPRSSSPRPGPSARRWWCSSPPVRPATSSVQRSNPLEPGLTMTAAMASQAAGTDAGGR